MKKTAIIVAAGSGSRTGSELPKQFAPINGLPMLAYSIKAFHQYDPDTEIILALPHGFSDQWRQLAEQSHIGHIPVKTVDGGHERFYSVANALHAVSHHSGLVSVHDAARPFVSQLLIDKVYNHAEKNGCAVPAIHIKDSLRVQIMDDWTVADRNLFRAVQTPQAFDLAKLKEAYNQGYEPRFTDDATVYESAGNKVYLVEGEESNLKITTRQDLNYAGYMAKNIGQN